MAKSPILAGNKQQVSPFDLNMSDDALVTFTGPAGSDAPPGALLFRDVGYMPVNELTIGGDLQDLKGKLDGLFIHYSATGVQQFASGVPTTADYMTLQYEIMGYKGDAIFGHAADGTPTLSGAKHLTVLAQGDLIPGMGHLRFGADGGITGAVNTSLMIDGQAVGTLDLSVQHAPGDIGHTATGGLTLDGGTLHATFVPLSVG